MNRKFLPVGYLVISTRCKKREINWYFVCCFCIYMRSNFEKFHYFSHFCFSLDLLSLGFAPTQREHPRATIPAYFKLFPKRIALKAQSVCKEANLPFSLPFGWLCGDTKGTPSGHHLGFKFLSPQKFFCLFPSLAAWAMTLLRPCSVVEPSEMNGKSYEPLKH